MPSGHPAVTGRKLARCVAKNISQCDERFAPGKLTLFIEVTFPARTTLRRSDRIVVRAIAEAMFSQDGEVTEARLDAHVADVDDYVSAASKPIGVGLRIALFVVRIAPILMLMNLRTLERLTVDERVAVLTALERSRLAHLSLAFIGWRTVMTLVFYEDPIELLSIGYAGEERLRHKRRLPALVVAPALVGLAPAVRPAPHVLVGVAPPAEESGVRLRTDGDADSEHPPAVAPTEASDSSREVA